MSALAHAMRQDAELGRALRVHQSEDGDRSLFGPIVRRAQARGEVSLAADPELAHEVTEGQLLRRSTGVAAVIAEWDTAATPSSASRRT